MKRLLILLVLLVFLGDIVDGGDICPVNCGVHHGLEQSLIISHLHQRIYKAFSGHFHHFQIVPAFAYFSDIPSRALIWAKMVEGPHFLKIVEYWHLGSSGGLPF